MKQRNKNAKLADLQRSQIAGAPWQLQTAKARFSELFRLARTEGPQLITRQNKDAVVMLPVEQFNLLVGRAHQPTGLVQFFRQSPLVGLELNLERSKDMGRDVEL
ncbi:MAG: type II toxin-antitoxin system prevent-host-death family antitoxin [Candidatus Obscuribacterales bacterium]|nr:type II toxin-antitoxin system prevent-host-death family antitoxin [Candidatus Obscuribacterales bacterium]